MKAAHYIDSKAENVGQALQSLGGAKIVLSTAPSAAAAGACIDGAPPLCNTRTSRLMCSIECDVPRQRPDDVVVRGEACRPAAESWKNDRPTVAVQNNRSLSVLFYYCRAQP